MTPASTAAAYYRARLGWPTFALGDVVWMTPGITAAALNIPADIGKRLLATGIAAPVFEIPIQEARWVFLVQPHNGPA